MQGVLRLEDTTGKLAPIRLASGQLANLWLFNLFGVPLGFEQDPEDRELMVAESDVVAFCWDVPALLKMSSNEVSWALANYWCVVPGCWCSSPPSSLAALSPKHQHFAQGRRADSAATPCPRVPHARPCPRHRRRSFLLSGVACHYAAYSVGETPRTSNGQPEPDPEAWLAGRAQTVDITDPLRPEELPGKVTFKVCVCVSVCARSLVEKLWRLSCSVLCVPASPPVHPTAAQTHDA